MQKNEILVSIIIPAYNSQDTIAATIESCLNQFWRNIEIIVVDNGSTDKTLEILKTFKDNRIQILEQKRKGACAARNLGISVATGEYIQFLDADDLLSADKISNQIKLLASFSDVVIASCSWIKFREDIKDEIFIKQAIDKSYDNPLQWLVDSWNGKGMGQTSIWFIPAGLIKRAGPWNEDLSINQDGEYFSRILLQADKIIYCADSKVYYRTSNNNSISNAPFTEAKAFSLLKSYQLYVRNMPQDLVNEEVKRALARNFAELIYRFDTDFPNVTTLAWQELTKLSVNRFNPIGGKLNVLLIKFLGFRNAVQIRRLFSHLKF